MLLILILKKVEFKMIPREFFVTSGKAYSHTSHLNAFDQALKNAGIAQCNLVTVSSIIPEGCVQIEKRRIPIGSITHAVIAKMDGIEGENIGSAISWSMEKGNGWGIVAETHGYMKEKALLEIAEWKLMEMAKIRELELGKINYTYETLEVPMDNYGCVISALVFIPEVNPK
jgi:arginine decarboxylase